MDDIKDNIKKTGASQTRLVESRLPAKKKHALYKHLRKEGKLEEKIHALETRLTSIEHNLHQLLQRHTTQT